MKIKSIILALSIVAVGNPVVVLAQNNGTTTVSTAKAQFLAKINTYNNANGTQSQATLNTIKSDMRDAIAAMKITLGQSATAANQAIMDARTNAYNQVIINERANNKAQVIAALNAFANTL